MYLLNTRCQDRQINNVWSYQAVMWKTNQWNNDMWHPKYSPKERSWVKIDLKKFLHPHPSYPFIFSLWIISSSFFSFYCRKQSHHWNQTQSLHPFCHLVLSLIWLYHYSLDRMSYFLLNQQTTKASDMKSIKLGSPPETFYATEVVE